MVAKQIQFTFPFFSLVGLSNISTSGVLDSYLNRFRTSKFFRLYAPLDSLNWQANSVCMHDAKIIMSALRYETIILWGGIIMIHCGLYPPKNTYCNYFHHFQRARKLNVTPTCFRV